MRGRPLWPPAVPRLAARPSQSNPRGSGPEVLKRERGHVTSEIGVAEVAVFGALQHNVNQWWLDYRRIYVSLGLNELSVKFPLVWTGTYLTFFPSFLVRLSTPRISRICKHTSIFMSFSGGECWWWPHRIGHVAWKPQQALIYWYPLNLVKRLQLIWRLGTHRWNPLHMILTASTEATTLGLQLYINGLVQERCSSSGLAMELHLSCINPSIYYLPI